MDTTALPANQDLLRRLAALNGQPLQHVPETSPARPAMRKERRHRKGATVEQSPARPSAADSKPRLSPAADPLSPSAPFLRLDEAVQGAAVEVDRWGAAFLVTRPTSGMEDGDHISEVYRRGLDSTILQQRLRRLCRLDTIAPEDLVFLDLETTGLGDRPLFLGGIMSWSDGSLVIRQYLARNYSEEAAVVAALVGCIKDRQLLVTFNGKTFDVPYLSRRSVAHRIPGHKPLPHLDLLHEARRAWRHRFPDCRLQTLEQRICGRYRTDDIDGKDVPEAYHSFVRTGNASRLAKILSHNACDLLTLAELLVCLPDPGFGM